MKTYWSKFFQWLLLVLPFVCFSQTKISNYDYEVTNDVVKVESITYSKNILSKISEDQIKETGEYQFKNGLIKFSKYEYGQSNKIHVSTYRHTKPLEEFMVDYYLLDNGTKTNESTTTHRIQKFKNLVFYFPTTDLNISENSPDKLVLSYKTGNSFLNHTFKLKDNNTIEEFVNTSYGPVVNTYDLQGVKFKEFFPGISGNTIGYDEDGLVTKKEMFGSAISNSKTFYYYEKDNKGNWVKKIEIEKSPNSEEKITFTARKLTYQNNEVTGSNELDTKSISIKLNVYFLFDADIEDIGCISGNCTNGFGKMVYESGNSYEGNFKDGIFQGYGEIYNKEGHLLFEGNFVNGKQNGKGTLYYKNGDVYKGNYVNGLKEGNGVFTYKNGDVLEGTFKNDEPFYATYTYVNGNKVIGNWVDWKINGEATYYDYAKGKMYADIYKDGKLIKTNSTTTISNSSTTASSTQANNIPDGIVWRKTADNKTYWLYNNKELIKGSSSFWTDNHLYVYKNDTKEIYLLENFKTQAGEIYYKGQLLPFKNTYGFWYKNSKGGVLAYNAEGQLIGETDIYKYDTNAIDVILKGKNETQTLLLKNFKNVETYKLFPAEPYNSTKTNNLGCIKGNCQDGIGTYIWENGDMFVGKFVKGQKNGQGTYTWSNGNTYTGNWTNNKINGYGKEYDKNGTLVYEGQYVDGKRAN